MKTNILLLFLITVLGACHSSSQKNILTISNGAFVDGSGREVILNGINHVNKNAEQNHIDSDDEEILTQFRDWGFNIVRFGINWAELEPEPGVINEHYLRQIDKRVQWAEELGIWLYLDFHQDLYGGTMGNGAPQWATITDGEEHVKGDIWSDSYVLSGAVHRAFDNFWENRIASDGLGLQDHYLNCLKLVSQRYKNSPSVAGYDVMNEPFMGSRSVDVFPALISGYVQGLKKSRGEVLTLEEVASKWSVGEDKMQIFEALNDKAIFNEMVCAADSIVNSFEKNTLSAFYQRARDAIRSTGSQQIIFLEHNYLSNLGVPSRFSMPVDTDGNVDKRCCYAPHGYDLVTDSKNNTRQGYGRVEFIFEQIVRNAVSKASPVIVGEWGAYYNGEKAFTAASKHTIQIFEAQKISQSYWSYWKGIGEHEYFATTIVRNYPMATNGELMMYKNDFENNHYTQKWKESPDNKSVTRVFVKDINRCEIKLLPMSDFKKISISGSDNGYLVIEPLGENRELVITPLNR